MSYNYFTLQKILVLLNSELSSPEQLATAVSCFCVDDMLLRPSDVLRSARCHRQLVSTPT